MATRHDSLQFDGQADVVSPLKPTHRLRVGGDVCVIFVHAGAGFHSKQNERVHLEVCEEAAEAAMALLKNGGNAVDAVEIAIKVLEDKEVTNAGWGSNLAMDGTVECDASIVDHYGRSGAVGAIGQIRNPIHLARLVLDHANKPLSLRRIPPNLLVGPGAVDFAYDQGIPVLPHDFLVSPGARSRWLKWKYDLEDAESPRLRASEVEAPSIPEEDLASCWNESQPYSPVLNAIDSLETKNPHGSHHSEAPQILANTLDDSAGNNEKESTDKNNIPVPDDDGDGSCVDDGFHQQKPYDGNTSHSDEDMITDTVGAIAVDRFGNIAAGSSSGGIGMKRRGRIGPAALVNVGTAVIPVEINDPNKTSVASVTSGTGEHMGTTLAAGLCASRVYSSIRRSATGGIEPIDDDGAMKAFVERDFMGHPSVLHSISTGAIGVLSAKKTVDGVWLYFAHNTDSFAVASMGSDDAKPRSLMSRNRGDNKVVTGGRVVKFWPTTERSGSSVSTWPINPDPGLNPPKQCLKSPGSKRQRIRRIPIINGHRSGKEGPPIPEPAMAVLGAPHA